MKCDFSGYATKNDLRCADGRTIRKDAFKHNDGQVVPLVWQHMHNDPKNVLGHALLENREDGVYAYCQFNSTEAGKNAAIQVEHGDISMMSIYANQLRQKGNDVLHGAIREVSLVLSGANPGALIDNVSIQHSDGSYESVDEEAIIYTGLKIFLGDMAHAEDDEDGDGRTMQDVFDTLNEEQKNVVYAMVAHAVNSVEDQNKAEHSEEDDTNLEHDEEGGESMKNNVFEQKKDATGGGATLTHDQLQTIFADAPKYGTLKQSFLAHAGDYGIDNIGILFPDAKTLAKTPEMISREMSWVTGVLAGTHHSPFSRIKSVSADITVETARAKGYVTGNLKKEEVFALLSRTTTPTTVYKKQKLDRDDMVDITDMDIVAWLKAEMRLMLNEELARAILVGDGREVDDEDKINESNIRPIYKDDDMYAHKVTLESDVTVDETIEAVLRARKYYKGSGRPTFYTTADNLTDMLLVKDTTGHRLYRTEAELMAALRVSKIEEVEVMENLSRVSGDDTLDLLGIVVNLQDYNVGADKGGDINMFDDFDIDYNQYKYLLETRCSGALTKCKSALIIEKKQAS